MSHAINRRECEAIRLLRCIVDGDTSAIGKARNLLRAFIGPINQRTGRPACVTYEQLRAMARLYAEGLTQRDIATKVNTSRHNVCHHLKPSAAMLAAMAGPAE